MKVFLINLEKDKEKRDSIIRECEKNRLDYQLINATDGLKLNNIQLNKFVREYQKNYLTRGEIGCSMSHLEIYKKMLTDNIPVALICEDDAKIHRDINKIINEIKRIANPNKKQAFLLQTCRTVFVNTKVELADGYILYECHRPKCTHGYIITKAAARAILSINSPVTMAADSWLYFYFKRYLKTYSLNRNVITSYDEDKSLSALEADRALRTEEQTKYRHKIARKSSAYYVIYIYHKMFRRIFLKKNVSDLS